MIKGYIKKLIREALNDKANREAFSIHYEDRFQKALSEEIKVYFEMNTIRHDDEAVRRISDVVMEKVWSFDTQRAIAENVVEIINRNQLRRGNETNPNP